MFGKNKKDVVAVSTLPLEEFEFLLGRNSILCGNLQTKGASRIDGHFKGIIVSENPPSTNINPLCGNATTAFPLW